MRCWKFSFNLWLDFSDDYIDYGEYGDLIDVDDEEDIAIEESQLNVTTSQSTVKVHKNLKFVCPWMIDHRFLSIWPSFIFLLL